MPTFANLELDGATGKAVAARAASGLVGVGIKNMSACDVRGGRRSSPSPSPSPMATDDAASADCAAGSSPKCEGDGDDDDDSEGEEEEIAEADSVPTATPADDDDEKRIAAVSGAKIALQPAVVGSNGSEAPKQRWPLLKRRKRNIFNSGLG